MTNPTHRVCANCVMDTSDPMIRFDEREICDHCRTFFNHTLPRWHTDERGARELDKVVARIKREGEGREFDCIVGLSGGIDSSFLTYVAKEVLGLRPLVFHVDAGWNSQEAVNNIERLVEGLSLDLYTEVINWDEMRDLQLAFFRSGVPHIDTPQDHAFFATMYKFAEQYHVKHILSGANISTECVRNPVEWIYYADARQVRDIHHQFGTRPLKQFPTSSILWHKLYLPYIRGIRVERLLNYLPYIKQDAVKLLTEKFGWQSYPEKHYESRFTRLFESYWLPTRFGYDVRRVKYSSLILTGQMSRVEAIEKLEQPSYDQATIIHDLNYVASKLGISPDELNGFMQMPRRTFRDYESHERLFRLGAKVMKRLGLEVAGKR